MFYEKSSKCFSPTKIDIPKSKSPILQISGMNYQSKDNMVDQYFISYFNYDPDREIVWKEIAKYLQKFIPLQSKLLELGAGYCQFINNVGAEEKHALDIFEQIDKYARPEVVVHKESSTNLKCFGSEYFDTVFASNFLEHLDVEECEKTVDEIVRVLKKDGKFILIQPNFKYCYSNYFDDYTHKRVFSHVSLPEYLKSKGFKIELLKPKFLPFSMKSRLPKTRMLVRLYLNLPIKPFGKQMLVIAKKK